MNSRRFPVFPGVVDTLLEHNTNCRVTQKGVERKDVKYLKHGRPVEYSEIELS